MKFLIIKLSILLLFVSQAYAQSPLAGAKLNGKWGFINEKGEWVIKPTFDQVLPFSQGLAAANKGFHFDPKNAEACKTGKWGFINAKGEWVVEPAFENVESFQEGYAKVNIGAQYRAYRGISLMGGKWGFIKSDGSWFIEPNDTLYDNFYEGYCAFKVPRGSKWGYIDAENKTIIEPAFWEAGPFSQGIAPVLTKDYTYKYINANGGQAFEGNYKKAFPFSGERAFVKTTDEKAMFIKVDGQVSFTLKDLKEDPNLHLFFTDGMAKIPVQRNGSVRVGYATKSGKWVVEPVYELGDDYHEGLALVFSDRYYYFLDEEGNKVFQLLDKIVENPDTKIIHKGIPNPNVGVFSFGLCRVKMVDKWAFINTKGKTIIKPLYEDLLDFSDSE